MLKMPTLGLTVLLALAASGCASDTEVQLECPSPDGSTMAVLFSNSGGGGAGSFYYQLALQPGSLPPTLPKKFGMEGPSLSMLDVDGFRALTLQWDDDQHLSVEASLRDLTDVSHLFHRYPAFGGDGQRYVHILYKEREPTAEELRSHAENKVCRTGGRVISNPPSRRLVTE